MRSLSPLSEISFSFFLLKIFKTSFLNLPLLGIPMLIVFFIIYFKFIAAPTAGTFFFDPKSEIN